MATQQYKKKPEVYEAMQYDGSNASEMVEFCPMVFHDSETGSLTFMMMKVDVGSWIVIDYAGTAQLMTDERFNAAFTVYVVEEAVGKVYVGRYEPRPIGAVEAVTWTGKNFMEVQVVCPQASVDGSVVSIPELPEVFVGEVVLRELTSGKFSKMDAGLFKVFYGGQLL